MLSLFYENDFNPGFAPALARGGGLQTEDEIIITRGSKPVAKLVRVAPDRPKRSSWNPEEHARWQRKVSGGKLSRSDVALATARADRALTTKRK